MRNRLPATRYGLTHRFTIHCRPDPIKGHLILNTYPDGRLGEGFLYLNTIDEGMRGFARATMTLFSIALQNDEDLAGILAKFSFHRFEPAGFTDNPDIPTCTSILDYVHRYISQQYPGLLGASTPRIARAGVGAGNPGTTQEHTCNHQ